MKRATFTVEGAGQIGAVLAGQSQIVRQTLDHVFGLTVYSNFSACDARMLELPGPARGKDIDQENVLRPWTVTMNGIGDVLMLATEARVGGRLWGGGSAAAMHHRSVMK